GDRGVGGGGEEENDEREGRGSHDEIMTRSRAASFGVPGVSAVTRLPRAKSRGELRMAVLGSDVRRRLAVVALGIPIRPASQQQIDHRLVAVARRAVQRREAELL